MSLHAFVLVLFLTIVNPQIQYVNTKPNVPMFDTQTGVITLSEGLQTEQCLEQMRDVLSNQGFDQLSKMYLYSGKGINDLGDYNLCNKNDDFEYVFIAVYIDDELQLSFGVCAPKSCGNVDDFTSITNAITDLLSQSFPNSDVQTEAQVPSVINSEEYSKGFWIVMTIFTIIWIFCILGMIIQFTSIGNKENYDEEYIENTKVEDRKNKLALFLYAWSPTANIEKLFTVKPNADQTLSALNGVRVLSICWVMTGHGFTFSVAAPIRNFTTFTDIFNDSFFGIVPGGFYAVDTFFFLSGFLSFYLLTVKTYKKSSILNWPLIYFHRYYRLIFPVIFAILLSYYIVPYLGSGPFYKESWDDFNIPCSKYWWTNLLFINNLYPVHLLDECIVWVWYLANDFQFFLMTPPLIYIYCKNRYIGFALIFLLVFASMLANCIDTAMKGYSIILSGGDGEGIYTTYIKPWYRMGAYFVGGLMGLSFFEYASKEKYPHLENTLSAGIFTRLKKSRLMSIAFFVIGFALTALYVFPLRNYYIECGMVDNCWSNFTSTIYNATCRPLFVFGVGLCIIPCFVGRLRVIQAILGNEIMTVLARLNYMVYMIHCIVFFWIIFDQKQASYLSSLNQWYFSIGGIVLSFLLAIPATLMFEVPFMNIEKTILFPAPKKSQNGHSNENRVKQELGEKYEALYEEKDTMNSQNETEKLLK